MKNILFLSVIFSLCCCASATTQSENNDNEKNNSAPMTVKIEVSDKIMHQISSDLFGYNIVYAETPDKAWKNGAIENFTVSTKTAFIRYPGGTVVTYWHWKNPNGHGWDDSWDPTYDKTDKPNSEFMDIDEYIDLVKRLKFKPLMGVNINSGYKYNRMEEGLKDALDLMDYCVDKGINVEYWYLGNEPYRNDCNGGPLSVEEYATLINTYGEAMRKKNPSIKLIVNWLSNFDQREKEYIQLLKLAGNNIDIFDIHCYWSYNTASWNEWLQKTPIGLWTGQSYIDEITKFKEIVQENGFPNIQLATLEWNVGPGKQTEEKLNTAQSAFIQSEMMMQFMQGGMEIATFWPLFWESGQSKERGIYNLDAEKLNPNAKFLEELSKFSSTNLLNTKIIEGDRKDILCLFSKDPVSKTIRGCILNKKGEKIESKVTTLIHSAGKNLSMKEYTLDNDMVTIKEFTKKSKIKDKDFTFQVNPYSIIFFKLY